MNTTNLLEEFKDYSKTISDQRKVSNIRTALYRYYVAGIRNEKTKKTRLDKRMLKRAETTLKRVTIDENFNVDDHLQVFNKGATLLGISEQQSRASKSYLKQLLDYIANKYDVNQVLVLEKKRLVTDKVIDKTYLKPKVVGIRKRAILISNKAKDYLDRLANKYPEKMEEELLLIAENNLHRLNQQFEKYMEYNLAKGIREASIKIHISNIKRLLGWAYKNDENLTIEDINFEVLIKVVDTRVNREEYGYDINKNYIVEGRLRDEARKEAKILMRWLEKFYQDYEVSLKATKEKYILALVSLSKFMYKDITDLEESTNYEDITIIKYLRTKTNLLEESVNKVEEKRCKFTWDEVLEVVESYRLDYEQKTMLCSGKNNGYIERKRPTRDVAIRLQRFLILAFFTVIPPRRLRVIAELELGRTLKYGVKDKAGNIQELDPKKNKEGKYYLTLQPQDYKTGATYGYFECEIPNKKYKNGVKFYDYINEWILTYREELAIKTTKTFFVKQTSGEDVTAKAVGSYVAKRFKVKTGIELNAHQLRNIFITYTRNNGATDEEKEAIAYAMGHDVTVADKVYNNQTREERLAPIAKFMGY